jgi:hypothetical protein
MSIGCSVPQMSAAKERTSSMPANATRKTPSAVQPSRRATGSLPTRRSGQMPSSTPVAATTATPASATAVPYGTIEPSSHATQVASRRPSGLA